MKAIVVRLTCQKSMNIERWKKRVKGVAPTSATGESGCATWGRASSSIAGRAPNRLDGCKSKRCKLIGYSFHLLRAKCSTNNPCSRHDANRNPWVQMCACALGVPKPRLFAFLSAPVVELIVVMSWPLATWIELSCIEKPRAHHWSQPGCFFTFLRHQSGSLASKRWAYLEALALGSRLQCTAV